MESPCDAWSDTGDIEIRNHVGPVVARSSTNEVDLDRVTAEWIDLFNTTGQIEALNLDSPDIYAFNDTGNVVLETDTVAESIEVITTTGGVDIEVPVGDYNLELITEFGGETVEGLEDNDESPNLIYVETSTGSISVRGYNI